jgi:hypothetical protein
MRRALCIATAILAVVVSASAARADDFFPPPWRGLPGSTLQQWVFGTSANPTPPNLFNNQWGIPLATISPPSGTSRWWTTWNGHQGVWKFEDFLYLDIPNTPTPNDTKYVWVQFTYYASNGAIPQVYSDPPESMIETPFAPVQIDTYFWHAVVLLTLHPNPSFERITIEPMDCTLYLDQVVVDTICIPEPASVLLLGFAALVVLRRR